MQKLQYPPPGSAPATVIVPAGAEKRPTQISLIEYDANSFVEKEVTNIDDLAESLDNHKVSWINVAGLGSIELIKQIGQQFRIHPLAIADVFTLDQRPHLDEYDRQLFMVLQMVYHDEKSQLVFEQLSLLIGEHFVITFQEEADMDVFEPVRARIRQGAGNVRYLRNDYLGYVLIDTVIDQYFPVAEKIGDAISEVEDALVEQPSREQLKQIHEIRRAVAHLRRAIWPQREILLRLLHDENRLLSERTRPFIRDTYDHSLALLDLLESYRDATVSFMDVYVSSLSMRTNEIVRVLTIVSTIFIPLTFIAGVYGMNFERSAGPFNMPELGWPYGYPLCLLLMAVVAGTMLLYLKRRGWL
ncbi:MAG: magnesium/cobalt transporter CorA [Verrucomicrobia bacterium]|nr:magnesium/cobalt transporter CorA [Verrucomicrobiota bacterium]